MSISLSLGSVAVYTTQDNGLSAGVKSTEGTGPPTLQHKHIAHTKSKYTPNYNTTLHLLSNSPLRKIHLCVVVFILDYIGSSSSAFLSGLKRGAKTRSPLLNVSQRFNLLALLVVPRPHGDASLELVGMRGTFLC